MLLKWLAFIHPYWISIAEHIIESSYGYHSTWPVYWPIVLVPVFIHGSGIELLTEVCLTSRGCGLCHKTFDILLVLTFSVRGHPIITIAECTAQMLSFTYLNSVLSDDAEVVKLGFYKSRATVWKYLKERWVNAYLNGRLFSPNFWRICPSDERKRFDCIYTHCIRLFLQKNETLEHVQSPIWVMLNVYMQGWLEFQLHYLDLVLRS